MNKKLSWNESISTNKDGEEILTVLCVCCGGTGWMPGELTLESRGIPRRTCENCLGGRFGRRMVNLTTQSPLNPSKTHMDRDEQIAQSESDKQAPTRKL